MASKLFDGPDTRLEDPQHGSRRLPATDGARYQLHVIGSDTTDVVQSVGGWLADRTMAGWDTTVACFEDVELLALRILGVNATSLESTMTVIADPVLIPALAITGDAFARDVDLRTNVARALVHGMTEFIEWGDTPLVDADHHMKWMRYRMSAAARAFKGHALQAVGLKGQTVGAFETFRRDGRAGPLMGSTCTQPIRLVRYRDRF